MAEVLSGRARNQTQDSPHKLLGNQHPRDGTDSGVSAINPTGALEMHSAPRRVRPADGSSGSNAVTAAPQPQHPDESPHRRTSMLFIGAPPPHPNSQDHLPPLSPNSQPPHPFLHQSNTGRAGAASAATSAAGPAPPPAPPLVSLRSRISPSTGTGLMAPASDRLRPSGAASSSPVMSSRFRNTGVSGRGAGSGAAGALKPAGTSRSVARGRPPVAAPGRTGGVRQAIRRGAPVVGPGSAVARAAESRAAAAAAAAAAAGTSSTQTPNGPQSASNKGPGNDLELNNSNTADSPTSPQRRESEPPSGSNSALLRRPFLSQRQPQSTGTENSTSTAVPPPLHSSFVPLLPLQGLQHRQSASSGAGLQQLPGPSTAATQQLMNVIDTGGIGSGIGSGDALGSQPSSSRPSSSRMLEGSSYPRYSQFQIPLIALQQQQQSQPQTPPPQAPRAPSQHQLDLGLLGIGPLSMFGPLGTAPVSMPSTIRPPSAASSTGGGAGAEALTLRALTPPTFTSSTTSFPAAASTSEGGRGLPSSSSASSSNAHTSRAAAAPMTRGVSSHSVSRNADDGRANEPEPRPTSIAFGPYSHGSSTTDRARSFDAALAAAAAALSLEGEPPAPQPQPSTPSLSSFPPPPALTHGPATSAAPSRRARTVPSAGPSTGPRRSDLVPSGRNAGSATTSTSSSQHPLSNRTPRVSAAASIATPRVSAVPSTTPPAGPSASTGGTAATIDRRPLARRNSSGSSSTASSGRVTASGGAGAGGGGGGRSSGSNRMELSVIGGGRISGGAGIRTSSGLLGDPAGAGAAARRGVTHANGRMDARDSSGLQNALPSGPAHSRDPIGEGNGMVGEQQRHWAGGGGADGAGGQSARLVGRRRESGNVTIGNAAVGGRIPLAPGGGGAGTGAARAAAAAAATRLMYDTHYGHTSDGDSDDSDDDGNGVIDGVRHHAVIHPPPRVFRMHPNEQHAADTATFGPARALGPPPRLPLPPPVLGARRRTSDDDGVIGGALALGGGGGGGSFQDRFLADLRRRDVERAMLMQLLLAGGEEELLRQAEEEQLTVALMLSLQEARPGAPDAADTEPESDAGRAGGAGAGPAPAPRTFTLRLTSGALLGMAHGSLLVPVAEEPSFSYEDLLTLEDVKVTTPQEVLDGLPLSTYDGTSSSSDGACAICQCDYEVGEQLVRLPCLHVLHNTCARQWLGGYSKRCPICKQALC